MLSLWSFREDLRGLFRNQGLVDLKKTLH